MLTTPLIPDNHGSSSNLYLEITKWTSQEILVRGGVTSAIFQNIWNIAHFRNIDLLVMLVNILLFRNIFEYIHMFIYYRIVTRVKFYNICLTKPS